MAPYAQLGLHTMPLFADKVEQVPAYAETQKRRIASNWAWLETEFANGREFVGGNDFTVADITGMTALMIGRFVGVPIPDNLSQVQRWASAVKSRASWNH